MRLTIQQGTTFVLRILLQNPDQTPVILTGGTAVFCIARKLVEVLSVPLSVVAVEGQLDLELMPSETEALATGAHLYQIDLTDSGGNVDRVLAGDLIVEVNICPVV